MFQEGIVSESLPKGRATVSKGSEVFAFFVQHRKGLSDSRQAGRVGIALAGEDNRCGPEREIVSRLSGP